MIIATLLFLFLGWRVYLHAVSNGKNGLRWAILTVSVAVGIQVIIMLSFWALGGAYDSKYGTKTVDEYSMIAAVIGLIFSLIAVLLIANKISESPREKTKL